MRSNAYCVGILFATSAQYVIILQLIKCIQDVKMMFYYAMYLFVAIPITWNSDDTHQNFFQICIKWTILQLH